MDPISLLISGGMTVASLGMSLFGSNKAAQASQQQAALSGQNAQYEMQVDQQRQQAMELDAKRKQTEVTRNMMRARSLALNTATNQGAQQGSALGGAYGQISGSTGRNTLGIGQDLSIGENIFGLNQKIDQNKVQMASLGGDIASGEGMMSFGRALGQSTGPLSNMGIAGFNGLRGMFGGGGGLGGALGGIGG